MGDNAENKFRNRQKFVRRRNSDSLSSIGGSSSNAEFLPDIDKDVSDIVSALWTKLKETDKFHKNLAKQGAIPKNYRGEGGPGWTNQNPYKWYRGKKNNSRHEGSPAESNHSFDTGKEPSSFKKNPARGAFPFYYVVPENPSEVNVLRPGTYLVIPQNNLLTKPLNVVNHPKQSDKDGERESNENQRNGFPEQKKNKGSHDNSNNRYNGRGGNGAWGRKTTRETNGVNGKVEAIAEEADLGDKKVVNKSNSKEELSNDMKISDEPEQLCDGENKLPDSVLAALLDRLPYFGEDYLKNLWELRKPEQTLDLFVNDLKERRINEVYVKVLKQLPNLSQIYLEEKVPEIMISDDAIQEFIEMEKIKESEEILVKLKDSLPDFDEQEICVMYDRYRDTLGSRDYESLLEFIRDELITSKKEERKIQELQMITTMLPDIDGDYVLSRLNEFHGDSQKLNDFMEELLENPNYPKAAECDPVFRERQKLWNYYVTNFSVGSYLKKVPEPEQFFSASNPNRTKVDKDIAIQFLENRFPDLDNYQLNEAFSASNESLFKTCELLHKNYLPDSSIDEQLKRRPITEAFLQEITFIVHKDKILRHIREEEERRELEIQQAEEENSFFECLLCFDSSVIPSDAVVCPEGHITCRNCLIMYIQTSFAEGKYLFPCLSLNCDTEYAMKTLEKVLKPGLFSKITQRRAAEDVDKAAVPGLEKCPSCDYAYVLAQEDKIFTCLNEDCLRVTCRLCKEPSHIPLSCKEVERPQDLQARQQVEEAMTKTLVRSCPNCLKKFIKNDGCNKIKCPCGVTMCYICSALVNDYNHFNGMGGSDFYKCPLYSNNEKLHVADVIAAGVQEKERIMRENPNIKFVYDPTGEDTDE